MSPEQIAAIVLSVLAIGAGGVGAVQVADSPLQTAPPPWADDADGAINVTVAGTVTPGANVTLTATYKGVPVPHAPVEVNGEIAGETDKTGQLAVEVPTEDEFEVEIEPDFEGERTIALASSNDDDAETETGYESEFDDDDERYIELATDGNVTANESVTVTATVEETPLAGAEIEANGEFIGTTDADGTIEVFVPDGAEELELEAEFEQSGKYEVGFEDETEKNDEEFERSMDPLEFRVNGTIASGESVTVTAVSNGTAVANATVSVNDNLVGETDTAGQITVTIPDETDEVEIEIETDNRHAELEYEFGEVEEDDESEGEEDESEFDDDGEEDVESGDEVNEDEYDDDEADEDDESDDEE